MLPIFTKESDGVVMPSRVKLDGIKSQPQLNGKFGVTMGYDAHAARYIVAVDDGAFIRLKSANLTAAPTVERVCSCDDRPVYRGFRSTRGPFQPANNVPTSKLGSKKAKDIYTKLYSGDFLARAKSPIPDTPGDDATAYIEIVSMPLKKMGNNPDSALEEVKNRNNNYVDSRFDFSFRVWGPEQRAQMGAAISFYDGAVLGDPVQMPLEAKQALAGRIMLILLMRDQGGGDPNQPPWLKEMLQGMSLMLPKLPTWLRDAMLRYVINDFSQSPEKTSRELIEVRCLNIEIALAEGDCADGEEGALGEALEALAEYKQAAALYAESAHARLAAKKGGQGKISRSLGDTSGFDVDVAMAHGNSGIAYRRANDHDQAEAQYVLALKMHSEAPGLHDTATSMMEAIDISDGGGGGGSPMHGHTGLMLHTYGNLVVLYDAYMAKHGNSSERLPEGGVDYERCVPWLSAALQGLLAAVGAKIAMGSQSGYNKDYMEMALRVKGKSEAMAMLVQVAASGPDVGDFRNALLQALRRDINKIQMCAVERNLPSAAESQAQAKEDVRKRGTR